MPDFTKGKLKGKIDFNIKGIDASYLAYIIATKHIKESDILAVINESVDSLMSRVKYYLEENRYWEVR